MFPVADPSAAPMPAPSATPSPMKRPPIPFSFCIVSAFLLQGAVAWAFRCELPDDSGEFLDYTKYSFGVSHLAYLTGCWYYLMFRLLGRVSLREAAQ